MTLHERLNEIHNEVMATNFESMIEGLHFDANDRARIRAIGLRLVALMDEYQALNVDAPACVAAHEANLLAERDAP